MATENEDILNKNDQDANGNKPKKPFLDEIIEEEHDELKTEIEEEVESLDTDFPLSGGEGPHTTHHTHKKENKDEEPEEKTSFLHDLDTDFPLSGGEVDE